MKASCPSSRHHAATLRWPQGTGARDWDSRHSGSCHGDEWDKLRINYWLLLWPDVDRYRVSLLLCLPTTSQELIRGWEVAGSGEGPRRRYCQRELGAQPSSAGPLPAIHFSSLSLRFLIWKRERENTLVCWDEFLGRITWSWQSVVDSRYRMDAAEMASCLCRLNSSSTAKTGE